MTVADMIELLQGKSRDAEVFVESEEGYLTPIEISDVRDDEVVLKELIPAGLDRKEPYCSWWSAEKVRNKIVRTCHAVIIG